MFWLPSSNPKAILQITHGMTEHIGRYEHLASYLNQYGIVVAGFDLRGHGTNSDRSNSCASLGETGWEDSLQDMHQLYLELEQQFPNIPHYMLGFSLGSFLLREYLGRFHEPIAGAIIMGTGHQPSFVLDMIKFIVMIQIKQAGFDETTPLVQKLSFDTYNQKFKPTNTSLDWLCSDTKQLNDYQSDILCKESISSGLFWQLLSAMKRTGKMTSYKSWNKEIPVLLLSGEKDPVGDMGKGVLHVKKSMEQAGMKDVTMQLFSHARHDLLHEEESGVAEEVRQIILEWITKR